MSRQRLGQNFLQGEEWPKKIVSRFKPSGDFGEIGPGHGELTRFLSAEYAGRLKVVFEKDREFSLEHSRNQNYLTVAGDFLDWDFKLNSKDVGDFSLIGNLPYESGTAIFVKVCEKSAQISHFLFLLQKEVVERLTAKPHTRDFGSLSVLGQGQYEMEALDIISPEAFKPAPQVFSQLVTGVAKRAEARHPLHSKYQRFVQSAFLHKRKIFRNALKSLLSAEKIDQLYSRFSFSKTTRAEEIEVDLWPQIYEEVSNGRA